MDTFLQGLVLGLREGLEAALIIVIILQYIKRSKAAGLRKSVISGIGVGIGASLLLGAVLYYISSAINKTGETAKLWESGASILALVLITTFIIWMIKHGKDMVSSVEERIALNFSKTGLFLLSSAMIAREGAEIAIFAFAGEYNLAALFLGVILAVGTAVLIYYSLFKVNLKIIFNITLVYLILQAGFLLGYGIHEGLSALKDLNIVDSGSFLYSRAYNFTNTVLNHKEGFVGLPLYVLTGWYSKPEWVQFIAQYAYTFSIFGYWVLYSRKKGKLVKK